MALPWIVLAVFAATIAPFLFFQSLLYLIRWYETANRLQDSSRWFLSAIFTRRMKPLRAFIAEIVYSIIYTATYVVSLVVSLFTLFRIPPKNYGDINSAKPLVVLIHGVFARPALFWLMRLRFRMAGIGNVVTFSYPPLGGDIAGHHEKLRDMILAYRKNAGITKTILVGHSYGGIIAFDYTTKYGADEVLGLATLGAPFRGSRLAVYGLTKLARSLNPWNPRFGEILAIQPPAPFLSVYSRYDQFVLPYTNSHHPKAERNEEIDSCGHSGLYFDSTASFLLVEWIKKVSVVAKL